MRHGFTVIVLVALLTVVVFFWSTSGIAVLTRNTTAPQDSLAVMGESTRLAPDSLTTTPAPPGLPRPTPHGLIIPIEGVTADELVDTFTAARSGDSRHDAIDIIAPRGARVLAAADGRIARLFTSEHGGLTIYQLGTDGETIYYYAHLDGYAPGLQTGQNVRQGDHIGFVGDSGNATPGNHHLHFAIWTVTDTTSIWDGPPINPYPLLQPARRPAATQ